MAPPLGFTLARSNPLSFCQASTTEAKASLISTTSMSFFVMPVFANAYSVAGIGAVSIQTGSAPRTDRWWMRARGVSPWVLRASSETTSMAAEASAIWLETAAVRRPPSTRVFRVAILAKLLSRGVSSWAKSPTGTISRLK